jgi:hypothetical protein
MRTAVRSSLATTCNPMCECNVLNAALRVRDFGSLRKKAAPGSRLRPEPIQKELGGTITAAMLRHRPLPVRGNWSVLWN